MQNKNHIAIIVIDIAIASCIFAFNFTEKNPKLIMMSSV